jgi:predicted membrane protein
LLRFCFHREKTRYSHDETGSGIQLALVLIAFGALLLCFNMEMLNPVWKSFFLSWPMLVFVIGIYSICRAQIVFGLIVAAVGKYFLIKKAAVIYPNEAVIEQIMSNFWPAVFIFSGVVILIYLITRPKGSFNWHCVINKDNAFTAENENKDGKINYKYVFSGSEQVILDPVFHGGTIETTFGGLELDLRRTSLPEGQTYLYINAVFGGVEITAPDTWDIEIKSSAFAGGVSDSRIKRNDVDHTRNLIVVAKCTFGGITIK